MSQRDDDLIDLRPRADAQAGTSAVSTEVVGGGRLPLVLVSLVAVAALGAFAVVTFVADAGGPIVEEAAPSPPPTPTVAPAEPARLATGPVLPESTGRYLVIGGHDSELRRVDLDTGAVEPLGVEGEPWLVEGNMLVVRQEGFGRWVRVDLGTDPITVEPAVSGSGYFSDAVPAHRGGFWVSASGPDGGRIWSRVDFASGEVLERVTMPGEAHVPEGTDGRPLAGPEVVAVGSRGLYALQPDGSYEFLAAGELVAAGVDLLLVTRCDDELACSSVWLDRDDGSVSFTPPPVGAFGVGRIVGDDTVLVVETFEDQALTVRPRFATVTLIDVATGTPFRVSGGRAIEDNWISPDGAFLASEGLQAVAIVDLISGESGAVPGVVVGRDEAVVWGGGGGV